MRMRSTRTCGKCVRSCEHLWALCLCVYPEPTNLLFTFSFSLHAPAKLISPSPSGRLFKQANKIRLLLFLEAKDLYAQKPTFPVLAYGLKPFSRPFKVQVHRFSWSFGKPSILLVSTHSFPMMANWLIYLETSLPLGCASWAVGCLNGWMDEAISIDSMIAPTQTVQLDTATEFIGIMLNSCSGFVRTEKINKLRTSIEMFFNEGKASCFT